MKQTYGKNDISALFRMIYLSLFIECFALSKAANARALAIHRCKLS